MMRNLFVRLPALGLLALTAACGGADEPAAEVQEPVVAEAPAPPTTGTPAATGNVIEVVMKTTNGGASGTFEPAAITAKKGDVIRFVNEAAAPHNVSFPAADNPGAANLPAPTPYVTTAGQSVEVPVTMDAGSYNFQCDPHAPMGMKGKLTVTE